MLLMPFNWLTDAIYAVSKDVRGIDEVVACVSASGRPACAKASWHATNTVVVTAPDPSEAGKADIWELIRDGHCC